MRELKKRILNREIALLAIILLVSLIIRWRDIENIPYGVENDEFSWIATSIFHQHNILASEKGIWSLHDTNAQRFPVSIAINILSFKLFGADFLSPRKILILVNIISLIFFYFLARKFLSRSTSLIFTLLYSLSAYKLIFSRIVLPNFFSELFAYPAILLLLAINPKKLFWSFLATLLAGTSILLSILTYNLAYMLPLVSITILIFTTVTKKIDIKLTIFLLFIFLLPLLFFSQKWFIGIGGEANNKSYAFMNTIYDSKEKKIYTDRFVNNLTTVKEQLFKHLKYSTGDMAVLYPGPLVNSLISTLFIFGVVFALFELKRYFPLVAWLLISSVTYQIILGLFLPRMWVLTIGLIYLFAGITLDRIYNFTLKYIQIHIFVLLVSLLSILYITFSNISLYYAYAINNPSFLISHREILEIAKKHKNTISENVLFVAPNETSSPTNINVIYAVISFTYLTANPEKASYLANNDRKTLGVLTKDEFIQAMESYLIEERIIIVDNTIFMDIENQLGQKKQCNYHTNKYSYFTEIIISCSFKS